MRTSLVGNRWITATRGIGMYIRMRNLASLIINELTLRGVFEHPGPPPPLDTPLHNAKIVGSKKLSKQYTQGYISTIMHA